MGRFLCLSDLHIDVNEGHAEKFYLTPEQEKEIDGVLIAGDIAGGPKAVTDFLKKAYPNVPVAFVSGNHIVYYEGAFLRPLSTIHSDIREILAPNHHLLENNAVVIGDTVIIGANLYTDYKLGRRPKVPQVDADGDPIDRKGVKLLKSPWDEWLNDPANARYVQHDCSDEEFVEAREQIMCPPNKRFKSWAMRHPEAADKWRAYEKDKKRQWMKPMALDEFQKLNMRAAQRYMNDFKYGYSNRIKEGLPEPLTPYDYAALHKRSALYIKQAYSKWTALGYKVVIMTHHAPHPQCLAPVWRTADTAPSYASDLSKLLKDVAPLTSFWLFGHTHAPVDINVMGVRLVNNSYGYAAWCENKLFNPNLIIET